MIVKTFIDIHVMGWGSVNVTLHVCGANGREQTLEEGTLHWDINLETRDVTNAISLRNLWEKIFLAQLRLPLLKLFLVVES